MGRLGRLGLEQPVRYERSRPGELVHVDVKSSAGSRAAPASVGATVCISTTTRPCIPTVVAERRNTVGSEYVQRLRRRLQPARLRRSPQRREGDNRDRVSATRGRVPQPRHQGRTAAHRQRLRLPRHYPRARLQDPRHPPSPHTALPATDKRESRTLHPHPDQRLGLRRRLSLEPKRSAALTAGSGTTTIDAALALGQPTPITRTNLLGSSARPLTLSRLRTSAEVPSEQP